MNGWMDRMLDYQERLKVDIQLDSYDQTMGEFESRVAIDSRKLQSPTSQWMRFGAGFNTGVAKFCYSSPYPYLQCFGCERNQSTFESVILLFLKFLYICFYYNVR